MTISPNKFLFFWPYIVLFWDHRNYWHFRARAIFWALLHTEMGRDEIRVYFKWIPLQFWWNDPPWWWKWLGFLCPLHTGLRPSLRSRCIQQPAVNKMIRHQVVNIWIEIDNLIHLWIFVCMVTKYFCRKYTNISKLCVLLK